MSVEGHWTVRYASVAGEQVQNESGGVATLVGGRILGGDTWSYYTGHYDIKGRELTLHIDVAIHYTENGESILGGPLVPFTVEGTAKVNDTETRIEARVGVKEVESAVIVAILNKVADL